MITEILKVYHDASEFDRRAKDWYRQAHAECKALADETGLALESVVGVVAVISPRLKWEVNVNEARRIIRGETSRALGKNVAKARRILAGEKPQEVVSGPKVTSFYRNILNPDDTHAVTIDTWAARVWSGDWAWGKSVDARLYEKIAADYREAAAEVGLLPCELQAITWENVRRIVTGGSSIGQLSF